MDSNVILKSAIFATFKCVSLKLKIWLSRCKRADFSSLFIPSKLIFFNWIMYLMKTQPFFAFCQLFFFHFGFCKTLGFKPITFCIYVEWMHFALGIQLGWRKHNCVGICYTSRVLILLCKSEHVSYCIQQHRQWTISSSSWMFFSSFFFLRLLNASNEKLFSKAHLGLMLAWYLGSFSLCLFRLILCCCFFLLLSCCCSFSFGG